MKKIKIFFLGLAIVLALGSAATAKQNFCEYQPQYRKIGPAYYPAGEYAYNYHCVGGGPFVCTYYKPNPQVNMYSPCRWGFYESIFP
jgi:hypothetical protein